MKAVYMTATGGADVLQFTERDEPSITSPDHIKVRLKAAGVNPIDTKLRGRGLFYEDALPAVLGCDGAGVVEEVGDKVTEWQTGDEVWFCHGGLGGAQGNYAELTVLPAFIARAKPKSIDFVHAAAGPLALITAWEALFDRARLQAGQSVLIHAGAGGVGHVAIQMAKLAGAKVCTTVGSDESVALVRQLGADEVIDYRQGNFVDVVMAWSDGEGVDVALECVGPEVFQQTIGVMADYGSLITLLDPGIDIVWKEARNKNLRIGFELMLTPMLKDSRAGLEHHGEILDQCAAWIDAGKLEIKVGRTYPLAEAAQAHARIESGHSHGKLVLTVD